MPEMTPRAFSFNSPHGACQDCQGLGAVYDFDPARARARRRRCPWRMARSRHGPRAIASWSRKPSTTLSRMFGIDLTLPFRRLPRKTRDLLFYGAAGIKRGDADQAVRDQEQEVEKGPRRGSVRRRVRRVDPESSSPLRSGNLARAGEPRTVSGPPAVPGLPRRAPEAAEPVGPGQGADHLGVRRPADRRSRCRHRRPGTDRSREPHRQPHPARDSRPPAFPQRRRRRLPDARPQRRDALGRRRAAHPARDPDRVEPDRGPLRPRRALDRSAPARQSRAPRRRWPGCAISATPSSSSSTTKRRFAPPTTSSTSGRAPASTADTSSSRARRRSCSKMAMARLRARTCAASAPSTTPRVRRPTTARRGRRQRRAREQPQEHRRLDSARRADHRHRRQRFGQVDARERDPLPGAGARSSIAPSTSPAPTPRSKASSCSTRSFRSTSRRSAGRRGRIPRPTPASSRSSASCSR